MKTLISLLLAITLSGTASAKNFYSAMKEELEAGKADKVAHYNVNRKIGAVVRFVPNIYYAQDMLVAVIILGGVGKEIFYDLPMPKRECSIKDVAANFKGLRDGINGKDYIKEQMVIQLVREGNEEIFEQKEVIKLLQERVEILEKEIN